MAPEPGVGGLDEGLFMGFGVRAFELVAADAFIGRFPIDEHVPESREGEGGEAAARGVFGDVLHRGEADIGIELGNEGEDGRLARPRGGRGFVVKPAVGEDRIRPELADGGIREGRGSRMREQSDARVVAGDLLEEGADDTRPRLDLIVGGGELPSGQDRPEVGNEDGEALLGKRLAEIGHPLVVSDLLDALRAFEGEAPVLAVRGSQVRDDEDRRPFGRGRGAGGWVLALRGPRTRGGEEEPARGEVLPGGMHRSDVDRPLPRAAGVVGG